MPQIPATSKSRSRSRYELLGNPTLLQCDSSDAAIAMTTTDVRRVMRATGAMVIRMRRSATVTMNTYQLRRVFGETLVAIDDDAPETMMMKGEAGDAAAEGRAG